jgi:hypothetical protein
MSERDDEHFHETIGFVGLRAQATALGLVQLTGELVRAGGLDRDAVDRINQAIARDITLTRPRSVARDDYERTVREPLAGLFAGTEDRPSASPDVAARAGGHRPPA